MRGLTDLEELMVITALDSLRDTILDRSHEWSHEEFTTVDNLLDELCRNRYGVDNPGTWLVEGAE